MIQYVQKNNYETVQLDGEFLVLNTDDYTVTKLNEVGGFCWTLLNGTQTVDSLVQAIQDEYAEESETIEGEIEAFLSDLIQIGLIKHAV